MLIPNWFCCIKIKIPKSLRPKITISKARTGRVSYLLQCFIFSILILLYFERNIIIAIVIIVNMVLQLQCVVNMTSKSSISLNIFYTFRLIFLQEDYKIFSFVILKYSQINNRDDWRDMWFSKPLLGSSSFIKVVSSEF